VDVVALRNRGKMVGQRKFRGSSGEGSSGDIINDYENRSGRLSISCVSGENPGPVAGLGHGNWRVTIADFRLQIGRVSVDADRILATAESCANSAVPRRPGAEVVHGCTAGFDRRFTGCIT